MSLLEITGLTHAFGDQLLYRNAEFTLNKGEHIGIVGQNGSGKSTLIKICTGQIIPDEGRVVWQPDITTGCLDQHAETGTDITMGDYLKSAYSGLYEMEQKMNSFYESAASGDADSLREAAAYQEQLELQDLYTIDTKVEQVMTGLGLNALGLSRPVDEMSGGQRVKMILAKLLLEKPDVLLLDEPTNFLDKEHVSWLADYLANLENAFMTVSHDYKFLEKTADRICDIDNEKITKYYGNYTDFLRKKTLQREDYIRQYTSQQKEIRKTEEFIQKNIAGRKSRMAKGRRKQLERMDKMEAPGQKEIRPFFKFQSLPLTNTEHLSVKHLAVGYYYPVLSDLCFSIQGGQKAVLTGFNGIGKSTLLKTLTTQISALNGTFTFSDQVRIGYFAQDMIWENDSDTPLMIISNADPGLPDKEIRKNLARCGISAEHAIQAVGTLSGGEQAKVKMCLLTLKPCNFLILDEPTNHLDIQAKEALKTALSEFNGTVLLVSHEEHFYRDFVQKIIRIERK